MALVAAVVGALGVGFAQPAHADAGDGTVTVTVVRDVFFDGTYHAAQDLGVAGIPVTLSDASGHALNATTDATGVAAFTPAVGSLVGAKYRVEASIPTTMSYLQPAAARGPAPALSPLTNFVDVSGGTNAALTMGVEDPADFSQVDTSLNMATTREKSTIGNDSGTQPGALVDWPYTRRGNQTSARPTNDLTQAQIGTDHDRSDRARCPYAESRCRHRRATECRAADLTTTPPDRPSASDRRRRDQ